MGSQIAQDTLTLGAGVSEFNYWYWILGVTSLILAVLIYKKKTKPVSEEWKKIRSSREHVDMGNVFESITKAKKQYKKMTKYHPDKFLNTPKYDIAEDIFKSISENKHNYARLLELEKEAKEKLD